MSKPKVLFLGTTNSARSQMAEGWLRHLAGHRYEAMSAGVSPGILDPLAVAAMQEVGIDISEQQPKPSQEFANKPIDYVITLCGPNEVCPYMPSQFQAFNWTFDDPAETKGTVEEKMTVFRLVRDEIWRALEDGFLCLCKTIED